MISRLLYLQNVFNFQCTPDTALLALSYQNNIHSCFAAITMNMVAMLCAPCITMLVLLYFIWIWMNLITVINVGDGAHNDFIISVSFHGPLTRYVKLRVAHASGMPGTFSPPPRESDPDMHHGTCVTHVPWCMPGSLTCGFLCSRRRGKHSGITGACATRSFVYPVRGPL